MSKTTSMRVARTGIALLLAGVTCLAGAEGLIIQRNASASGLFSSSIWVADTLYVSGMLPEPSAPPPGAAPGTRPTISGDTHAQTLNILTNLQKLLKEQGLGMGDVIQVHVYLVGDPAHGGRMDFGGMNSAYSQFFGTPEQPNKPVRGTVQVTALAIPSALVEIEVTAVRPARRRVAGDARKSHTE